jgi:hypothetical protein
MDDNDSQGSPSSDFNKLDLTQLQNFSFGTQWTQDKSAPADRHEGGGRPRRDGPAEPRRDRRAFRKPANGPAGGHSGAPERPEGAGERRPRRDFRNGPNQEGGGQYRGPRFGGRNEPQDRGPYESPLFSATFYPEDNSFNALAKTIRASCRTIELFEIARTVIGKNDRFVVVLTRKPAVDGPARQPIHISVPDGLPFETEEEAVNHVIARHLGLFFEKGEVEVDPPKGNYQVINKCGVTGELLGPPNYHRYNQIVQQHYAANIRRMPPEAFRARIETVRDPEVVNQWLEKMKRITRYTWKTAGKPVQPAAAPAPTAEPAESAQPAPETAAAAQAPAAPTFDTAEDARLYLLTNAREKVVKSVESARFHGSVIEALPPGEIRRAVEGALERQRRFPLDTANGLRGRLRREHFTIFKKGSKGISYVCAVKRKFRTPGQTFADSIGALISFIEAHPMTKASELANRFPGIAHPAPEAAPAPADQAAPAAPAPELTVEQRANLSRMQGDLRWLVTEGYVTEFIDGRLFAPPAMVEARKREVEGEEHDPENFPDAPETPAAPASPPAPEPAVSEPVPAGEAAPQSAGEEAEQPPHMD